jgi:(p)ppGpp synthase/HD superfamily hydrolase
MSAPTVVPSWRLAQALAFAVDVHALQERKGAGTPYVAHLMAVSAMVLENGGDEEQAIAGLLHDVIEDGGAEFAPELKARFGKEVARIVGLATDAATDPKPLWRARKERYVAKLATLDRRAALVVGCDKLHNARAIVADVRAEGAGVFARFTADRPGIAWYYGALAAGLAPHLPPRLAAALTEAAGEVVRLAEVGATPLAG